MIKLIKKTTLILTLVVSVFLLSQCNDKEPLAPQNSQYTTSFSSGSEFLASKAPAVQKFAKDASSYISIISENGYSYDFSPGSLFLNGSPVVGNVDIEIVEVANKSEMIFSGVTTLAGDRLLASGGMFDISISQGGLPVTLNGSYSMSIPYKTKDFAMQIFEGEEVSNPDGSSTVNWVTADSSWIQQDSTQGSDSGRYYMNLNFLSWCNLDKFYNATDGGQVRLKLPSECTSSNTTVYMIFEENSVVNLFADATLEEFNSGNYILPLGWDIKLLAVCVDENKELQYALVDSEITDPHLETVTTMTKITEADLEALIKAL